ncbi:TonB-dependent receptor family protein [Roseibacillus persicicus]|uniref:Catecholate siderophore receptor CirA n=1 Tax=Roseibacillus persicicus TaxID=454148 RepID=A0A918WH07_9BACT|nr:TonB-dependent receptor [Roseibacillus persicicus]GHC46705.1 catecholate siderophore receptor CirA [Roseibacillus persicicus]
MKRELTIGVLLLMGSLGAEPFVLDPTLVTADRWLEPEEEAQGFLMEGSAIVLGEELLGKATSHSLPELLEVRAGVSFDSFFGNSSLVSPRLRGFGEGGQLRTVVTVDGLPVNRSDMALVPWSNVSLGNLEKVSLLRGGRSVRYGSGASAGVIALETRRNVEEFTGSVEGTVGDDETYRQRLRLGGVSEGWSWTVQGEHFDSDGYRANSGHDSSTVSLSILSPEARWGESRTTFSASRSCFEDPGALDWRSYQKDPRQSLFPDQSLENETVSLGKQIELKLGEDWSFELKGSASHTERVADYQGRVSDGVLKSWEGEAVFARKGEAWSIEAGGRYRWSQLDFERSQPFGSNVDVQLADLSREVWGGFVTMRWEPVDNWAFSAGASWDSYRLDGDAQSPNDAANPRRNFSGETSDGDYALEFGFEYQLTEQARLWGRYDRSLRLPVLDEVAFFQGFESDLPFNTGLRPEHGQGGELGVVWEDEGWTAKATFFGQWMEDEIFYDAVANVNDNLPETERLGMELELNWEGDCWDVNLFYAATLSRFQSGAEEGRRVPLVPRHSLSGTLTWHLFEQVDLGLEGCYSSSRVDGNERVVMGQLRDFREIPGYVVWNVSASWEVSEACTVFCRVNNLFDRDFISTQYSDAIYPGTGRQALVGARWEF